MQKFKQLILISVGKLIGKISKLLNLGAGGTWPGEIALRFHPQILSSLAAQLDKIILVAGTNGKTTTAKMVETIISKLGNQDSKIRIVHNATGANLLNGITSALIREANIMGKIDANIGIFEVDEASLPLALREFTPNVLILLNLFRDQLDRYGEVDLVAEKWLKALRHLPASSTVVINADDAYLAFIGSQLKAKVKYFGLADRQYLFRDIPHAADTIYCPRCGAKLEFAGLYLSHLGEWSCGRCQLIHPKNHLSAADVKTIYRHSLLKGIYNLYNLMAAILAVEVLKRFDKTSLAKALKDFQPVFGRQEEFSIGEKKIKIFLAKNPASFNASLRTVLELLQSKNRDCSALLLVLNDRIPDGRDVSWIWDVDFEMIPSDIYIIVSGDRAWDMGLRIKYAQKIQQAKRITEDPTSKLKVFENLNEAVKAGLQVIKKGGILYVLPTYSAMLEVRRILIGRKIL